MKLLRQNWYLLLSFFLQAVCFGLLTVFVSAGADAESNIRIIGCLFILAILSTALHFRYVCMKKKLEKDLQMKADSVSRFCHTIRTPLTTLNGIAEIFGDAQGNLDSQQKELIRRLRSCTAALRILVTESFDASDIKSKVPDCGVSLQGRFKKLFSFG